MTTKAYKPPRLERDMRCEKCNKYEHKEKFIEVTYESIIAEFEANGPSLEEANKSKLNQVQLVEEYDELTEEIKSEFKKTIGDKIDFSKMITMKASNDRVPPFIQKYHPKTTNQEYDLLRHRADFYLKKVNVCQTCFIKISKLHKYGGSKLKLVPSISKNIPQLLLTSIEKVEIFLMII